MKDDTAEATAALAAGRMRFFEVELEVGPGALVPRRETELLARRALARLAEDTLEAPLVIDMCCGVGNLACAIATQVPTARVFASDLTEETVALATRNVERLGLSGRVTVLRGDLFAALDGYGLEGAVDLVVANPPYISSARLESDRASLLEHEPREAFDAGPYGLTIHQRLLREAWEFLRPHRTLAFEMGAGQERQVLALARRARRGGQPLWSVPELVEDEQGRPRVAMFRRNAHTDEEERETSQS
ncbi:MAG TPA: HemK/PrmC family methyltransferase [Sandaracinaceae bacterium LLY-WYZ-13_1]|nr:HemK/PrmC family methyltransferase [Sandaracinaceae bacterium LLY-WYZ-13_1]